MLVTVCGTRDGGGNQVFEYSFHQLRVRNAEEMRGRLHITFQNEEGIDAGGLTREW